MSTEALYKLMAWLSPSFPVGAFSYSHGLEWLIETRAVTNEADLRAWVTDVVRHGSGRTDAILVAHAYRGERLREVAQLAAALAPSAERHLETTAQGNAFADTVQKAWLVPSLRDVAPPIAYPIAVARAVCDNGIALSDALVAYLHAFAANLVSAGVRLIPLGQTAGQRIIASLEPAIAATARAAADASLDDIGSALVLTDIASAAHETQYTRLFRS